MGRTAALRVTSFAASAALLAAIALAALTVTITLRERNQGPSIPAITIERPPEPPVERPRDPPRHLRRPAEQDVLPLPLQPSPFERDLVEVAESSAPSAPSLATITSPSWLRRPSNLRSYYPRRALLRGVEGNVLLNCRVSVAGVLDCDVVAETPGGWASATPPCASRGTIAWLPRHVTAPL